MELRLGGRVEGLEVAILKGLKAISDKVSAALAEKLDLLRFNEFKMQVRADGVSAYERTGGAIVLGLNREALSVKQSCGPSSPSVPQRRCCSTSGYALSRPRTNPFPTLPAAWGRWGLNSPTACVRSTLACSPAGPHRHAPARPVLADGTPAVWSS